MFLSMITKSLELITF